jgi:photosystem II stability/assembly factor-like uncharacterized protein
MTPRTSGTPGTLILGTRKGLLIFERRGGSWRHARTAHLGVPVPYAFYDSRTGLLWASLDHGHWGTKLSRSADLGSTWTEVAAPKYPADAEVKDGVPATLRYVWVMAGGGADHPSRLYLGTDPGGLFRSDDGGETFELVAGLWNHPSRKTQWFGGGRDQPGIHSVLVDPRSSERVMVAISCAGVFATEDGGRSWTPRNRGQVATFLPDPQSEVGQDPHIVVRAPSAPEVLWMQNHCGIFRSTNNAESWTMVSQEGGPAHFGFAIAVDEKRPDTAWVVPARSDEQRVPVGGALCVCRTEDGGRSWTALRRGLPQEACFDLVYRHALDLRGSTLAFGSTNGNLYASEDGGESWQTLSAHLPLVYSVRFADV